MGWVGEQQSSTDEAQASTNSDARRPDVDEQG